MLSSKKTKRSNRYLISWNDKTHQVFNLTELEDKIILETLQEKRVTFSPNLKNMILLAQLTRHLNTEIYTWSTDEVSTSQLIKLLKDKTSTIKEEIRKHGDRIFPTE